MATIYGDNNRNNLQGTNQDDTIYALGEIDHITGFEGDDYIDGGDGVDYVQYSAEAFSGNGITVNLALGIATDAYGDTDTLISIEGVYTTQGDDFIIGSDADNHLIDIDGEDDYDGGNGFDRLTYRVSLEAGVTIDMTTGVATAISGNIDTFSNIQSIEGTSGNDHLIGDANDNHLAGYKGVDLLEGGLGDDTYIFSVENNAGTIIDTGGFDEFYIANSYTLGVNGISSSQSNEFNLAESHDGNDLLFYTGYYWHLPSNEKFVIEDHFVDSSKSVEQIRLQDNSIFDLQSFVPQLVVGTNQNDTFLIDEIDGRLYQAFNPDDTDAGGTLGDVADFSSMSEGIVADLRVNNNGTDYAQTVADYILYGQGNGTVSTLNGFETVIGSDYDDIIRDVGREAHGGAGNDEIDNFNGARNSVLYGGDGNDTITTSYSYGNTVYGGDGDDTIYGITRNSLNSYGIETLYGDAGNDYIDASTSKYSIIHGGADNDTIIAARNGDVYGEGGDDILYTGNSDGGTIDGGDGDDIIYFQSGANWSSVLGGAGNDTIYVQGGNFGSFNAGNGDDHVIIQGQISNVFVSGELDPTSPEGYDIIDFSNLGTSIEVESNRRVDYGSYGNLRVVNGFDELWGTNLDDTIDVGDINQYASSYISIPTVQANGGDDVITAGSGNHTFIFNLGDGHDTIHDTAGLADTISFGDGILSSDVIETQNGNDLVITIMGSPGDSITVIDHFGTGTIENITFAPPPNLVIYGTENQDTLIGGEGHDRLIGLDEDDYLDGGKGSDTYEYGDAKVISDDGYDTIQDTGTEPGDYDVVTAVSDNAVIGLDGDFDASNGIEEITAGGYSGIEVHGSDNDNDFDFSAVTVSGIDTFRSGGGNDNVIGTDGNDNIYGDGGADTLSGSDGDDVLSGGAGVDVIDGGGGSDTASFDDPAVTQGVVIDMLAAQQVTNDGFGNTETLTNIENITGSQLADNITGDQYANTLSGGAGDDLIYGKSGDDVIYGGEGNDTLYGNYGEDIIYGGAGDDVLHGNKLGDRYIVDLAGSSSTDTYVEIEAHTGTDVIEAAEDNVVINLAQVLTGIEEINGMGYANVEIRGSSFDISASAAIGIAAIRGTAGNDNFTASYSSDLIYADDGNDVVYGMGGDDVIYGGAGNDTIYGNYGEDIIHGGAGADTLHGGKLGDRYIVDLAGSGTTDTYVEVEENTGTDAIEAAEDNVVINLAQVLTGIEEINGMGYANVEIHGSTFDISASTTSDIAAIRGTSGNDNFTASISADVIYGEDGADIISAKQGNDVIYGGDGDDTLYGNSGDDVIYGGAGADVMTGGLNADTFVFEAASAYGNVDTIVDFDTNEDDVIDISDLLSQYDPLQDAIDDFVTFTESGGNTIVSVDADGTGSGGSSQNVVNIQGVTGLDIDDLITDGHLLVV